MGRDERSTPPPVPDRAERVEAGDGQQRQEAQAFEDRDVAGQIEQVKCGDHAFEEEHDQQEGEQRFDRYEHWSSAGIAGPSNDFEYIAICNIVSRTKMGHGLAFAGIVRMEGKGRILELTAVSFSADSSGRDAIRR